MANPVSPAGLLHRWRDRLVGGERMTGILVWLGLLTAIVLFLVVLAVIALWLFLSGGE